MKRRPKLSMSLPPRQQVRQSGAVLVSLILVAASCWMLTNLVAQVLTSAQLDQQREDLLAQNAQIEARNTALAAEVAFANSPEYADQKARELLEMAKEGDVVVLPTYPDVTATVLVPTAVPLIAPTPQPNWRLWKEAILP